MATTTSSQFEDIVNSFEEIVPFSVSSMTSSSSLPSSCFDVFINHRGSDVKYTLATNIRHKLTALGLTVFLDNPSLQLGDLIPAQIEEAIRTASLHIAIFSLHYTESPWCLAELSSMLGTGKRVIPVFYHVDPCHLRWVGQGKGIYAPAFSHYQDKGRYSSEKLDEWKMVLEKVSLHSGCVIKDSKDEAILLKNIVNKVSKELKKGPFLVADKPVGLDDIVRDFERTVKSEQIVGIVGMGGAGKTTLAKELYNRKSSSFQYSSIVFAVRDAATRNALHEKQKKLLKDLGGGQGSSFDNIEEGKAILANRLRSVPALIVLDDVDHRSQLDALLPTKDCLTSGSLVIVTTRESDLLEKWGSIIYKIKPLNREHAKQLFCWHAFLQSYPEEGFDNIVQKFVEACSGLPLSLQIFGGLVYGKSKNYWESQLDKISRILPEDISGRLKVSYNALDEEEKEMFMDVACFFIREKKSWAIVVWDGSGWSGLHGWETLVNKCLVNLDEDNYITMHDHLRDLGRELARRHSPSRIWSLEQIIDMQKHTTGGMSIRGIDAARFEYSDEPLRHRQSLKNFIELIGISNKCFGSPLPSSLGLKLFIGKEEQFIKYFGTPLEDPVCLRLDEFKGRKLLSWSLRNLRILKLNQAYCLRELWNNSDPPLQLRELDIPNAHELQRIPKSIGRLEELKRIVLTNCAAIKNLPEEFCSLRSLEWLELSDCSMLSSLPTRLEDLINLRHVDLSFCPRLRILPDCFKQLRHLQHLNLRGCEELTVRSDMLEDISNLEYLNFKGCRRLEQLPNQIKDQMCLKKLDVRNTGIREVPSDIGELTKLEVLEIGSSFLASLPSSLGNLSNLTQLSISSALLPSLPSSLGNLFNLTQLSISSPLLASLPVSFEDLSHLTELNLYHCKMLNSLPEFVGSLNMLKKIEIHSTGVSMISITEDNCPCLETLTLGNNDHQTDMFHLPKSLRRLEVFDCKMLKAMNGYGLANLQSLSIKGCPELYLLAGLEDLHSIKDFSIEDCDKVLEITWLADWRSLETLEVVTSWKSQGIQSLEGLEKLKRLVMVAENISALQPCIETITNWPDEMFLCARAVRGAKPIMNSLSFPALTMVRSLKKLSGNEWGLECGKTHTSDAAIVCFLVNSFADTFRFYFRGKYEFMRLNGGNCLFIGLLGQGCMHYKVELMEKQDKVKGGILLVGEAGSVLDAFRFILRRN